MPDTFWIRFTQSLSSLSEWPPLLISLLLVAAALWHWRPQDHKYTKATFSLALLALFTMLLGVILRHWQYAAVGMGLQKLGLFVVGLAVIRCLGLFLFRLVLPLCRIQLLRIFEDLAELAGYCFWLLVQLHDAGLDLGSLVTTSAVITAVLAFSMQDTLGNILGGLALQLDNSIKVGDWIKVDDVNGQVVDIRWRYTAIETRNWETVVVPNSLLMKGKFSVLGRRKQQPLQLRRWVYFDISYEDISGQVITIVEKAIRHGNIANVASYPEPSCVLLDFAPSSARYGLRYWLTNIEADDFTDSVVRHRLYAALQRAGIQIPYPSYKIHLTHNDAEHQRNKQVRRIQERIDALLQVELFKILHEDELTRMAEQLIYTPFAKGDVIMHQGAVAHSLYILIKGTADIFIVQGDGEQRQIDSIEGGSILGEMGLMTGAPRSATVIASSEVLAYRLDKASFETVLSKRPEIAVEISRLLASRRDNLDQLKQQWDNETGNQSITHQQSILEKIRGFFRLQMN